MNPSMKPLQSPLETLSTDKLKVCYLGFGVAYDDAMATMREAMQRVDETGPVLFLLEHKDVITKTRLHGTSSFLISEDVIRARGIDVIETDRGGDVTFHGEGQLVGYLVKRLNDNDLVGYVRSLETALVRAARELGVAQATTLGGKTGVWIPPGQGELRKLIAIGVGVSKGVTRHGFALNITTDLEKFTSCIVPCGLKGLGVTSLERELLAKTPSIETVCQRVVAQLAQAII